MPSGFEKPSDLPYYYNEKSQAERANDMLREEMLRVRSEIDGLKSLLSTRLSSVASTHRNMSFRGIGNRNMSFRGIGRGAFFAGLRRKTAESKNATGQGSPLAVSSNVLGQADNFTPELGRDRSVDIGGITASGSSRTMRKALSSNDRPCTQTPFSPADMPRSSSMEASGSCSAQTVQFTTALSQRPSRDIMLTASPSIPLPECPDDHFH